jgi:hypothetical protein
MRCFAATPVLAANADDNNHDFDLPERDAEGMTEALLVAYEMTQYGALVVPRLLTIRFTKSVFTSLKKEHPTFVHRLGLRIATATLATPRKMAVEAVA